MKGELFILGASFVFVLMTSLFIFNMSETNLTGLAISNNSEEITEVMAEQAIIEVEEIIEIMKQDNFTTFYLEDILSEAKVVFEQAQNSEILRDSESNEEEKIIARRKLSLVNWKEIDFSDVLEYNQQIKKIKLQAYILRDKIQIEESKDYSQFSEEVKNKFEQVKISFTQERYDEADILLKEFYDLVENEKSENSRLKTLQKGTRNFFQNYWHFILLFLILASAIGYFGYKKYEKIILEKKIRKMATQKKVLSDLIKKAQEERYKENKISGLVYNIRIKNYKDKIEKIKRELPVLESQLNKFEKK